MRAIITSVLLIAIVACSAAPPAGSPSAEPSADASAIEAGRAIYVAQCVSCHGASGDGNGEYSLYGGAPVPDMRPDLASDARSDEELRATIRDGVPGTSMPGYGMVLNDVQIDQLTAYLRALGQGQGVDQAALATEQARPPTPTPIPDVQEPLPPLAFVRDNQLWLSDGNGDPRQRTSFSAEQLVRDPVFAPDSAQIAFVVLTLPAAGQIQSSSALYLMNRDGSDLRILRPSIPQGLRAPTWSSDGNALFVTTIDGEQQADGSYRERSSLVRIDLMSNAEQPFLENARDLVLHAATGQIAYISPNATGTGVELRLADAAGDQQRSLIAANIFEEIAVPRFAPDGTSLIVAARGERLDQGGALDTLRGWFAPPSALAHGTPWDFWRVDLITGELRRLTAIREDEPHAAFSPTGSEIVIHGVSGIYRMNADGSQLRRIDTFGGYGGVDWAR